MSHGKHLYAPGDRPQTVKDFRRIAGRLENRARYLRTQRHNAQPNELVSLTDRIGMAEHNARIIRQAIKGKADHEPLSISAA